MLRTDTPWLTMACERFELAGIPFVQVGYDTEDARFSAAVVDSFSGAYLAVQYLVSLGHERIATIRWQAGMASINSNRKHAGYLAALADAGLQAPAECDESIRSEQGAEGWVSVREPLKRMLDLPEPPTACFIENNFISMPLLYRQSGDGVEMPDWLGRIDIVHFEDWPLDPVEDIVAGKLFNRPREATVVAIDWQAIGSLAGRMLIENATKPKQAGPKIVRMSPALQRIDGNNRKALFCKTPAN